MSFRTEDDFWDDYYDRLDEAEREAQATAESAADLYEFADEYEREEYIQRERASAYNAIVNGWSSLLPE